MVRGHLQVQGEGCTRVFGHGTMPSTRSESRHLSWHSERNFIPRLINLSSSGIGPILVWRRENTTSAEKMSFFCNTKRKLVDTDVFVRFDNTD